MVIVTGTNDGLKWKEKKYFGLFITSFRDFAWIGEGKNDRILGC